MYVIDILHSSVYYTYANFTVVLKHGILLCKVCV